MRFEPENNGQRVLIAVPAVFTVLATLAVGARLRVRRILGDGLLTEDYFVLFALVNVYGLLVTSILKVVIAGAAAAPFPIDPDTLRIYVQLTIVRFELWVTATAAVQIAALLFYVRLFGVKRYFRILCYLTMAVVAAWWIATFITELADCSPFSKHYMADEPGHCVDTTQFCSASTLIHVVFDFWILTLPFPIVWQLHKSAKTRLLLTALFGMGVFASVCAVLRLTCLIHFVNLDTAGKLGDYLSLTFENLEAAVGLICVCLPMLKPVVDQVRKSQLMSSARGLFTSQRSSSLSDSHTTLRRPSVMTEGSGGPKPMKQQEEI